jgi:AcrR family transcriptional regulator
MMRTEGRAKRLPRAVRERQIMDAAVDVFSRLGFHAASMDEISDVAGVSKPMIYAYLGSKEDLFAACIHREATQLLAAVAAGVRTELPPDMQLWHGLAAFFSYVGSHRESWRVVHRQSITQGGPFSAELLAMRRQAISLVDTLLVRVATKEGLDDNATESLAAALVGAAESLADWWLDNPEVPSRVVASRLMNLVWMGFGGLMQDRTWHPSD